jgi:2,4-dienoyl-CoA reductase (NADPH2)
MRFPHLFEPLRAGPVVLKNRVVMPALHLHHDDLGRVSDRLVHFYAARANGGAALLVVGGCSVDLAGGGPLMPILYDDEAHPGFTRLASVIHEGGALAGVQLFHAGRYSYSFVLGEEPVAPSPLPSRLTGHMPRELDHVGIVAVIRSFGDAAERATKAGFDVVEVLGSAGYLLSEFLSPLTNQRTDEWGGSLENRMRLPREVVAEVRRRVGPSVAVSVRVSGSEFMGDFAHREELPVVARMYGEAGADLLNVTGGWHESRVPQITGHVPTAAFAYLARRIKEAVAIPIVAANRIDAPSVAEELLRGGWADAVSMGRPLLADPELPAKARDGREAEIRPCIACNQECLDAAFEARPVGCTVNPKAGHEGKAPAGPALAARKVAVVGAGVAGLEAARTARLRGHEVTLFEHRGELGGDVARATGIPGKGPYLGLLRFYAGQMDRLGVEVLTDTPIDADMLVRQGFEAVILATGATPLVPPIPGVDRPHVFPARDALSGRRPVGRDVVILGAGGLGLDLAYHLADADTISAETVKFLLIQEAEPVEVIRDLAMRPHRRITLVEKLAKAGRGVGRSTRWILLQELDRRGVRILLTATLVAIETDHVLVDQRGTRLSVPADTVLLAAGSVPSTELFEACSGRFETVLLVGDASGVRDITSAIREGMEAGEGV